MASRLWTGEAPPRALVRCWGDFAIEDAATGADVRPRGRKARALLAYLLLHPGKKISRDRLTGLLWGDRAEEQARGSLRQALFELRDFSQGPDPLIRADRQSVAIVAEAVRTDLDCFRELLESGAFAALLEKLPDPDETFLAPLDGLDPAFDEWLQVQRTRQHDALVQLVSDASAGAVAAGQARLARRLHARLVEMGGVAPPPAELALLATPAPVTDRRVFGPRWARAPILVAGALLAGVAASAPWWVSRPVGTAQASHREASGLYASALPMIRDRDPAQMRAAADLLRRAVVLEPDFAKGWAALATVLAMLARSDQDRIEAERDARHALALDPELAEAHAALGMILRFTGAEARAHLKRAVALNPRDPQTLFWLANHYATMLEFEPRMEALRRAVALDPYWARGANEAAVAAWQLGNRDEARRYAERLASYNREQALDCEFRLDLADGAYASIVRKLMLARSRSDSPATGDAKLGSALLILGRVEPARMLLHLRPYQWTVASGGLPSPAEFREVEMGSAADWFDSHDFLDLSMQRLLAGGRASELVARFEAGGPGNLSQLARRTDDRSLLVAFAPDMALALRAVGRARDADALLSRTDAELRRVYAAGPVPDWVDAGLARLRAAQGRRTEALAALARAIDRGWHYAPLTPMPDIANLYAFRSLQGDPRFEALRHQLLDRLERERRSLGSTSV